VGQDRQTNSAALCSHRRPLCSSMCVERSARSQTAPPSLCSHCRPFCSHMCVAALLSNRRLLCSHPCKALARRAERPLRNARFGPFVRIVSLLRARMCMAFAHTYVFTVYDSPAPPRPPPSRCLSPSASSSSRNAAKAVRLVYADGVLHDLVFVVLPEIEGATDSRVDKYAHPVSFLVCDHNTRG